MMLALFHLALVGCAISDKCASEPVEELQDGVFEMKNLHEDLGESGTVEVHGDLITLTIEGAGGTTTVVFRLQSSDS